MSKCNHENERTKDTHNIAPVNAQRRQRRPNAELCTKARSEMQNPDPNQLNPDRRRKELGTREASAGLGCSGCFWVLLALAAAHENQ